MGITVVDQNLRRREHGDRDRRSRDKLGPVVSVGFCVAGVELPEKWNM